MIYWIKYYNYWKDSVMHPLDNHITSSECQELKTVILFFLSLNANYQSWQESLQLLVYNSY